jgi:hypothetical protein
MLDRDAYSGRASNPENQLEFGFEDSAFEPGYSGFLKPSTTPKTRETFVENNNSQNDINR